jgi:hypothetical protein
MADQDQNNMTGDQDLRNKIRMADRGNNSGTNLYQEETATEISVPIRNNQSNQGTQNNQITNQNYQKSNADSNVYGEETATELAVPVRNNQSSKSNQGSQKNRKGFVGSEGYGEETAAEIAAPVSVNRPKKINQDGTSRNQQEGSMGMGFAALALSILSLFVFPVLFGAVGIVLGFVARRRGAKSLGSWAIGIGAISIILGIFVLPFF